MYEHRTQPLLPRKLFIVRLLKHFAVSFFIFFVSLGIGVLGYRFFEGFSWLDAILNASMILGGMGPVDQLSTVSGKIFASFYALFSGVIFLAGTGIIIAPVAHRIIHRLQLQEEEPHIMTPKETKMIIPEYISKKEVQRICQELGIRDWTKLTEPRVSIDEAKIIQAEVGNEAILISADAFKQGLEVELEHGVQFPDANVTNNHPILTGMIVLAHLKEMLDYYVRLEVAELEGDLLKALHAGDTEKLAQKYQQFLIAQAELSVHERASTSK